MCGKGDEKVLVVFLDMRQVSAGIVVPAEHDSTWHEKARGRLARDHTSSGIVPEWYEFYRM
jgi:hypothetical protein